MMQSMPNVLALAMLSPLVFVLLLLVWQWFTLAACALRKHQLLTAYQRTNLSIRDITDPYAIAYLANGEASLLQTVVSSLLQRGWLITQTTSKSIWQGNQSPTVFMADKTPTEELLPMERDVLTWFRIPRTMSNVAGDHALQSLIKPWVERYRAELVRQQFLLSDELKGQLRVLRVAGIIITLLPLALLLRGDWLQMNPATTLAVIVSPVHLWLLITITLTPKLAPSGTAFLNLLRSSYDEHWPSQFSQPADRNAARTLVLGLFGSPAMESWQKQQGFMEGIGAEQHHHDDVLVKTDPADWMDGVDDGIDGGSPIAPS